MHRELVVNQSRSGVYHTAAPVMQSSTAALPAETGVVPVGLAVMQTGMAVFPQRPGKTPSGIAVMHGGSGGTSDGIAMVHQQSAEVLREILVMQDSRSADAFDHPRRFHYTALMGMPVPKLPADWEPRPDSEDADPFRYGWRPKYVRLVGGKVEEQRIPLTAADLLDPQLGDEILVQGGPHATFVVEIYELLKRYYKKDAGVLVTFDMKIVWGIPGLSDPAPDTAVIQGIHNKAARRSVFDVQKEGARPCLVVEVVSPQYEETRNNDYVAKVEIYERAGVSEYVILEPSFTWKDHVALTGYRLGLDGHYQRIEPDSQGRLLSETTGLLFGEDEDGSVLVIDSRTGKPLRKPSQIEADEEAAQKRAARETKRATREAEARKVAEAEIARLRAELDRRQ